ncbi:helix-turn-helix domain-containing protein [Marinomonas sp.]|uniref:helix-turn-helix domain-containing protein n=1 Tax=Marinomonas sp. TaxID=1904862 RepID=UPI003F9B844E
MNETGFSHRLLATMKQKKISQARIAEAMQLSRTAVNKWTKGGMVDDNNLNKLSEFLGVDKIWLKYGDEDNTTFQYEKNINEVHYQDQAEIVTWEWDLLTDELSYSENVEKVYGVKLTSNQDYWQLMDEGAHEKLNHYYQTIIQEGGAHEIDFKITNNGTSRWITSRAAGVHGANGKITRLVGISMDNTERKVTELKLKATKSFFKAMLIHMNKLVAFTDIAGEILESNVEHYKENLTYLTLQTFIYNALLKNPSAVKTAKNSSLCSLQFEQREMTIFYHLNDEKQPFLLIEII